MSRVSSSRCCGRRLVGLARQHTRVGAAESTLVGRQWEIAALAGLLDRSIGGHGCVAGVVGPSGIGKSRIVAEIVAIAASRGTEVFSTFCESHASEIPFHPVARVAAGGVRGSTGVAEDAARVRVSRQIPDADPMDLVLFDDMLGIRDPGSRCPTSPPTPVGDG